NICLYRLIFFKYHLFVKCAHHCIISFFIDSFQNKKYFVKSTFFCFFSVTFQSWIVCFSFFPPQNIQTHFSRYFKFIFFFQPIILQILFYLFFIFYLHLTHLSWKLHKSRIISQMHQHKFDCNFSMSVIFYLFQLIANCVDNNSILEMSTKYCYYVSKCLCFDSKIILFSCLYQSSDINILSFIIQEKSGSDRLIHINNTQFFNKIIQGQILQFFFVFIKKIIFKFLLALEYIGFYYSDDNFFTIYFSLKKNQLFSCHPPFEKLNNLNILYCFSFFNLTNNNLKNYFLFMKHIELVDISNMKVMLYTFHYYFHILRESKIQKIIKNFFVDKKNFSNLIFSPKKSTSKQIKKNIMEI
ncbi:hypothetical protein RFI_28396, partial [Reticulomyxa filosa]